MTQRICAAVLGGVLVAVTACSQAESGLADKIPFLNKQVRGYVLAERGELGHGAPEPGAKRIVEDLVLSGQGMLQASLPDDEILVPLSGAEISVGDVVSQTDDFGAFSLKKSVFGLSEAVLSLTEPQSDGADRTEPIEVPLVREEAAPTFLFVRTHDRRWHVYRLKKGSDRSGGTERTVFLLHGSRFADLLFASESKNIAVWDDTIDLARQDYRLAGLRFLKFNYPAGQDIVRSSMVLGAAVRRYRDLAGNAPLTLACYGIGGLLARHYTTSRWYVPRSVDKVIMVGTPNYGYLFSLDDGRESSRQSVPGSELLRALNGRSDGLSAERYLLNSALQGDKGLNRAVAYSAIAGNVSGAFKDTLGELSSGTKDFMVRLLEKLGAALGPEHNEDLEPLARYYERLDRSARERLAEVPDHDFLVTVESAKGPLPAATTVEFGHTRLLEAENDEAPRYTAIRKALVP